MVVGRNIPTTVQTYGKTLNSTIFIKSKIDQKNHKLGMVIIWTTGKKNYFHGNKINLEQIDLLTPI